MRQNRFTWDQIQFPAQQLHWKLEVDRGWQSKSQAKCQSQQHLFQKKKKRSDCRRPQTNHGSNRHTSHRSGRQRWAAKNLGVRRRWGILLSHCRGMQKFMSFWINNLPIRPSRGCNFHFDRLVPWLCCFLTIAGVCIEHARIKMVTAALMCLALSRVRNAVYHKNNTIVYLCTFVPFICFVGRILSGEKLTINPTKSELNSASPLQLAHPELTQFSLLELRAVPAGTKRAGILAISSL